MEISSKTNFTVFKRIELKKPQCVDWDWLCLLHLKTQRNIFEWPGCTWLSKLKKKSKQILNCPQNNNWKKRVALLLSSSIKKSSSGNCLSIQSSLVMPLVSLAGLFGSYQCKNWCLRSQWTSSLAIDRPTNKSLALGPSKPGWSVNRRDSSRKLALKNCLFSRWM